MSVSVSVSVMVQQLSSAASV
eukprot:COSAG01_NODE_61459_length_289_cov_1.089474_2_plen_20_part_01